MTKKQLVIISAIRDVLDFLIIGQILGLNWLLNLPVLYLHFRYAGWPAVIVLIENIPVVGGLPVFTVAALSYPDRASTEPAAQEQSPMRITHSEE